MDAVCKGEPAFFYSFQGFGRIRSTQPTGSFGKNAVCKGEPAFFYSFQGFGIRSTQPLLGMAAKTVKALGFNRSLVDVVCKGEPAFFYSFQGFGRIRSTQPTGSLEWPLKP